MIPHVNADHIQSTSGHGKFSQELRLEKLTYLVICGCNIGISNTLENGRYLFRLRGAKRIRRPSLDEKTLRLHCYSTKKQNRKNNMLLTFFSFEKLIFFSLSSLIPSNINRALSICGISIQPVSVPRLLLLSVLFCAPHLEAFHQ